MAKSSIELSRWKTRGPGKRFYGRKLVVRSPSEIVELSKALSTETRISILKYLSRYGSTSISELAKVLNMTISNVSIQVRILKNMGLVDIVDDGYKKNIVLKIDKIILVF